MNCYEVMQHKRGEEKIFDKCISSDTCLTKEQAIQICTDLNAANLLRDNYKYYWRIREHE